MGAKKQPKFAVIGTGSMAAAMMATFARADVQVTAVVSRDWQRSSRFASAFAIRDAADDLNSVLRGDPCDAVYIANASADHASMAIAAMEAGKAVMCEKPLALTPGDAERVADVSWRTGTLCMEGLWIPFLPAYRRLLELARANTCGAPVHLFADFGYPVSENAIPRLFSPTAGGVLLDRGVYLVALALDLFGPVESVDAQLNVTAQGLDQHASMQLRHRGGGQSQLAVSFTALMSNTASLACTAGLLRLEEPLVGTEALSIRHIGTSAVAVPELDRPLSAKQKLVRALRQRPILRRLRRAMPNARREHLLYGADPYLPQLHHFLALLEAGAKESDMVPLELSLNIQHVIERARAGQKR
jgi:predicted dehydrogenase